MLPEFTTSYLKDSPSEQFRIFQEAALERAMAQVQDEQLFLELEEGGNSIAIIAKHMVGNMRSRWVDFLTTDGEKPDRNRDSEFQMPPATREALMQAWEEGWGHVFHALVATDRRGSRPKGHDSRRGAPPVMQAVNRQLAHYSMHIGQIVMLAKHFAGERWQSLSIPRNRSAEFNRKVSAGEKSQRYGLSPGAPSRAPSNL